MKNILYIVLGLMLLGACSEEDAPTYLAPPLEVTPVDTIVIPVDTVIPVVTITLLNITVNHSVYDTEDIIIELKGEANKGLKEMSISQGSDEWKETTFLNSKIAEKSFAIGKKAIGLYDFTAMVLDSTGLSESLNFTIEVKEKTAANLVFNVNFDGGNVNDLIAGLTPTAVGTSSIGADRNSTANNAYQGAADSYLLYDIADTTWMDQTLTIAMWYKNANPEASGRAGIVTLWSSSGLNGIATLRRDKGYSSNWGIESGDTWCGSTSTTSSGGSARVKDIPYTNDWQLIVYTVDGEDVKVYVDGELSMTNTLSTPISWAGVKTLSIGSGLPNYKLFNYGTTLGQIDEVQIYDTALGLSEIQALLQ